MIQIQKDSMGAFGLESTVMGNASSSATDALDYNISLQTEANILQSDSLALRVIEDLHMETTQDFYPPARSFGSSFLSGFFFWKKPVEAMTVPLERAPNRRYVVLKIFSSHLKVEPITGTRLIEVKYSSPDPLLSASVVNHLVDALMDYTFQARFRATAQASSWLTTQLEDLRKETERLQDKAVSLQRDTGMFGDDESHNVVLARLEELNHALSVAESNRILKESVYRVASSGDPELISGLGGNAGIAAMASMSNSLGLIQSLRAQEATVKAELDQDMVKYGAAYPKVTELQAELKGVGQSIHEEVHRIGERARTDYEIAARAEVSAREAFEKQKKLANDLNDKAIAYGMAKQEADGSREVYEGLLAKLKQAGVLEGLRSTNITVVSPARIPSTNHPKSPNLLLYYAAACISGAVFGVLLAALWDAWDTTVRSLEELEAWIGAPLFGLIPAMESSFLPSQSRKLLTTKKIGQIAPSTERRIATLTYIDSPFTESLRSLRTSLMLARSSEPPQVILVTSSCASEGKSTISVNLATVLAQQGARVLLVDADLRRPVLHQRFNLSAEEGLSTLLSNERISLQPQNVENAPNLFVLCGGPIPPFPAELLGSVRMRSLLTQWRVEYDFIVLDGPPVLPVTDAVVLSQACDSALLVSRYGFTEKSAVRRAYQMIARNLPERVVLGAVLNGVPGNSSEFYDYYGYNSRVYGRGSMGHEAQA